MLKIRVVLQMIKMVVLSLVRSEMSVPECTFMFSVSFVPDEATEPPPRTFRRSCRKRSAGSTERLPAGGNAAQGL